jgi:hypothetical protein
VDIGLAQMNIKAIGRMAAKVAATAEQCERAARSARDTHELCRSEGRSSYESGLCFDSL